jgi:hypothetical protein
MSKTILLIRAPLIIVFSLLALYLSYNQTFVGTSNLSKAHSLFPTPPAYGFSSDTPSHLELLKRYFNGETYIPHPMWHYLVWELSLTSGIGLEYCATFVSAFFLILWGFLVFRTIDFFLTQKLSGISPFKKELILWGLTISICFIGPMNFPWINPYIYQGTGSPTVWHNVTLWTVKPLALLASFYIIRALKTNRTSHYIYSFLTATLSLFAKPSFFIVYLPSLIVLFFYRRIRQYKARLYLATLSMTGGLILLYQFKNTFGGEGIKFDPLGVWSIYSSNIPYSILMALLFPIFYYRLAPNTEENDWLTLSWLMTFFGIIQYALFAERGTHYSHGNFGWSYQISLSLLYLFTIADFAKNFHILNTFYKFILSVIFLLQVGVGLYYFFLIIQGVNPVFAKIQ